MDNYRLIFILLPGLFIRRRNYHYHSVGGGYSFDSWLHLVSENPTGGHQHCSGTRTGGGGWQVLPQQWGQYLYFSEATDAMIHCISNKVVGCHCLNQKSMPHVTLQIKSNPCLLNFQTDEMSCTSTMVHSNYYVLTN